MKTILLFAGALAASALTLAAQTAPSRAPLPNYDVRATSAAAPDKSAAVAKLSGAVPGLKVELDAVTGAPKVLSSTESFLTGPDGAGATISAGTLAAFSTTDSNRVTKAFVEDHRELFGHGAAALGAARVTRDDLTAHNGMHTMVWNQQVDGIEVFEAKLISHTTRKGELINISSGFLADPAAAATKGTPDRVSLVNAPAVSARQAVAWAARDVGESVQPIDISSTQQATGAEKKQKFSASVLKGEADAKLSWLPVGKDSLRLCWDIVLMSKTRGEMFRSLVDAQSGVVLLRRCLTSYISDVTYLVWTNDSPSPFSPGWPTPNSGQPSVIARSQVTLPAMNTNASPLGWIGDGGNETVGNNVDAHADRDNNNLPDLPRPQGSPSRVFNQTIDLAQDPTNYTAGAVVQLFYLCNWYHDKLYELGFNEASGNFQSNNFARGGAAGNDAVQADAQDGGGTDNANFSTPPDGSPGRMQMYIFSGPSPRRDGDFDAEVVFHEHTHGLSWRLVGGGQALGTTQSDGMGEGWSDWYSLALLSQPTDDETGNFAEGGYVTYQLGGLTQNYYYGIRRYPYSIDMLKNPLTFKDIDGAQASTHPGISRSPIIGNTANEVHNEGEVWCVTLREARYNLIQKYGWAVGNQLILQLVTDGMKLTVPQPNFLQARDGILQADQVDTGGANYTNLWAAFAKRGMGASASSPASTTTTGVHEAFDMPDALRILSGDFVTAGAFGGPFSVTSTNYVLTNTGPVTVNWSLANNAAWINASPTSGTLAPGAAASVSFTLNSVASNSVAGTYTSSVYVTNVSSGAVLSRQFTLLVVSIANDICSGAIAVTGTTYANTQSTVNATSTGDPTPSCASFGKGVWYSYTSASSGTMIVDTIGSSFDTVLATYSGTCGAFTQIGCNDDSGGTFQSRVTNNLAAGVTYYILAGGWSGGSGTLAFHLNFSGAGPAPPVLTSQPASQSVNVGGTATFSVTATGAAPLSYQWKFSSTNLPGATSSNLVLNNVQLGQAGTYYVVVTNAYGSTNSFNAVLTVNAAGTCTPPPSGAVSWWQGEGNLNDFYGANNGSAIGAIGYTASEVNQGIQFNGSSYVSIPASASLDIGTTGSGITIEGWIKPGGGGVGMPVVEWNSISGGGLQLWVESGFRLFGNVRDTSAVSHTIISAFGAVSSNNFQHVALTYDKSSGVAALYLNGVQIVVQNFGTVTPLTTSGLNLGYRSSTGEKYTGLLDELAIYNRGLSSNEIAAIYLAGSAGKCTTQVCDPPPSGLISWWPGEGTANDIIGTNNGTLSPTGASYVTGHVGQAFRFDGTNGYVSVPDSDSLKPANVTVESWVWLDPAVHTNPTVEVIMFKKNTRPFFFEAFNLAVESVDYGGGNHTNRFEAVISSQPGTQVILRCTTAVQRGVWYHVATTYDGNRLTIYVNGVAEASVVAGFPLDYGTRPLFIGQTGEAPPYDNYLGGIIDEPSLYSRALSSNEIAAIYLAGSAGKCTGGTCDPAPSGLVGWWKGDGTAMDAAAGNNGTLMNAGYTNGIVNQAFSFDPENLPFGTYSGVQIADQPAYALTNSLTIEGWIRPRGDGYTIFFRGDHRPGIDPYFLSMNASHVLNYYISDEIGNSANLQATLNYDVWTHIAATLDGASSTMRLYTNGVLAAQTITAVRPFGALDVNQSPGIGIGNVNDGGNNFPYIGDVDEISLYNRALSQAEIQAVMTAGSGGKCPLVVVTNGGGIVYLRSTSGQPWGLSDNENALTQVFGSVWQDLRYETADPNGVFAPSNRLVFMEGGQFTAQAMGLFLTNNMTLISSWVAAGGRLLVNSAPNVIGNIDVGFGVTLVAQDLNNDVTAADASHPIFNGPYLPVGTAFSGTYFDHAYVTGGGITPILLNDSDNQYALAEKAYQSGYVLFGCMTPPFFHSPQTESSNLLANVLAYIGGQNTNQPPPPATNDVIHFDDLLDNNYGYKIPAGYHGLVWSNFYELNASTGSGGFSNAVVSPNNVAFNRQGGRATIRTSGFFNLYSGYFTAARNDNLVLTAVGRGNGGVLFSNEYVLSATAPTLLTFNFLAVSNVTFEAAGGTPHPGYPGVSNQFVLDDVSVTILPGTPPSIETDPQDVTVLVGDTATFTVGASGSTPLYYYWQLNGTEIPGATNDNYSFPNAALADSGSQFSCLVSNAYGSVTSAAATLTVTNGIGPSILSGPANQWVAAGGTATFEVVADGNPILTYQWQHTGTNLVDATNSIYSWTVTTNDPGSYSVIVSNAFGTAQAAAFLTLLVNSSSNDFVLNGRYVSLPVSVNGQFVSLSLAQGGRFNPAGTGGTNGVDFWYPGTPLYNYVLALDNTNHVNGSFLTLTVSNLSSPTVLRALITGTVDDGPVIFTRNVSFGVDERVVKVVDSVQNNSLSDVTGVVTLDNVDPDQGYDGSPGQSYDTYNDVASVSSTNDVVVAVGVTNNLSLLLGSESGMVYPSAVGFDNEDAYAMLTVVDPDGARDDIAINLAQDFGTVPAGSSTNATWFMVFGTSYGDVTNAYHEAVKPKLELTPINYTNCLFHFSLTGPAGTNYQLQAGTDLMNWSLVYSGTLPPGGVQGFNFLNACLYSNVFFRAKFVTAPPFNQTGMTETNGVIDLTLPH